MSLWKVRDNKMLCSPSGPWRQSFVPGRLESLSVLFHRNHIIGTLLYTDSEH